MLQHGCSVKTGWCGGGGGVNSAVIVLVVVVVWWWWGWGYIVYCW